MYYYTSINSDLVYPLGFELLLIFSMSSLSIHSSVKPQLQHIYRLTLTDENAPVIILFPPPYALFEPFTRIMSLLLHFGQQLVFFILTPLLQKLILLILFV